MKQGPTVLRSDVTGLAVLNGPLGLTVPAGNVLNLRIRSPEDYPGKLKRILDLITFNETPKVVGSYAYLNHRYPSDVDVFDKVVLNLNKNDAANFYAQRFK